MLTGGGRRTEKLFLYFSFYKTPENTDSLPLDFTLTWKGQLQGWRWLAPQDAELCRISQSFWQVVVFSVEILKWESKLSAEYTKSTAPLMDFPLECMWAASCFPPQPFSDLISPAHSSPSLISSCSRLLVQSQPPTFSHPAQISPHFPSLPFLYPFPKLLTCLQALASIFLRFEQKTFSVLPTTSQKNKDIERPGKTAPKAIVAQSCSYTVQKQECPAQAESPRYSAHSCCRDLQSMC